MKKIISMIVTLLLVISLAAPAYAADSVPPAPAPMGIAADTKNPLGELDNVPVEHGYCEECMQARHFSLIPHLHSVTAILNEYVGGYNRGVVAELLYPANTTSRLGYSKTRSVSNTYSVDISFSKSAVEAAVGYSVTFSDEMTASYELDVPSGYLASITLYDMYDVTEFEATTSYYNNIDGVLYYSHSDVGEGWAAQWTHFAYSGKVWLP